MSGQRKAKLRELHPVISGNVVQGSACKEGVLGEGLHRLLEEVVRVNSYHILICKL